MRRLLFSPRWLALHVATITFVVAFTRFGVWQWDAGRGAQGTLRNLAYGIQWWIFAGFTVFLWWRMLRAELAPPPTANDPDRHDPDRRAQAEPAADVPRYSPPAYDAASGESDDELAAYNRFLAGLHQRTQRSSRA